MNHDYRTPHNQQIIEVTRLFTIIIIFLDSHIFSWTYFGRTFAYFVRSPKTLLGRKQLQHGKAQSIFFLFIITYN